jgi:hypothetical protein
MYYILEAGFIVLWQNEKIHILWAPLDDASSFALNTRLQERKLYELDSYKITNICNLRFSRW